MHHLWKSSENMIIKDILDKNILSHKSLKKKFNNNYDVERLNTYAWIQ